MQQPEETLAVLGERVEVLVSTATSKGSFCMLAQTSPPGGGPPPHVHAREDEVFVVLEGEFEVFDGQGWTPLPLGQPAYKLRGQPHTFRNCGKRDGKILAIAMPGGLDEYFRAIEPLAMPQDMERLLQLSGEFGITFLGQEPKSEPPL